MRYIVKLLVLVISCGFLSSTSFAQEEGKRHVFLLTTWKSILSDDGSQAKRDSLLIELFYAQESDPELFSQLHLNQLPESSSGDWVIITQYAKWADDINQKLNSKSWPAENEQTELFDVLVKHFEGHSNGVHRDILQYRK